MTTQQRPGKPNPAGRRDQKGATTGAPRWLVKLQKIHRRDLILLSGVLLLACISVLMVTLLILSQGQTVGSRPQSSPGATGTPGPKPTYTVTYVQVTGLRQYQPAEAAARAWAADAQLVGASAGWSQLVSLDQIGAPTTWTYRFYSPAKMRLFFVTLEPDGQTTTIEHAVKPSLPPPPIPAADWLIDSPAALATWLDYGGGSMIKTNPGLELLIQLRMTGNSPHPVWVVIGADNRTQDVNIVAIDAVEGVVVTTSPPGS